jgi:DUF1680 family protein
VAGAVLPGAFAAVSRQWKTGDRVDLELPLRIRSEELDAKHPSLVSTLCGPQVLFAVADVTPDVTRQQLLSAKKAGPSRWQADLPSGPMRLRPFTAIDEERYATYLRIG